MTIVITGATGFIGTAFVRACRHAGIGILPVTRSARDRESGFFSAPGYAHCPQGDILVHLAEERDIERAEAAGADHVSGAVELARRVLDVGYARVVYASSAVVYGDEISKPRRPDEAISPRGAYARAKMAVEGLVQKHAGGVVARLANVYGAGMAHSNVLADILTQAQGQGSVRLRDVTVVRDFISVEDVARGLLALATGTAVGVYNIGTGIGHSVSEVARIACQLAGQPFRPIVSVAPSGRISTLVLDVTSTRADFKWEPVVMLRDGIRQLVNKTA